MNKSIFLVFFCLYISDLYGQSELLIEGNNIWVRETPVTGKVVMKLNTGDRCTIIERGDLGTIRGNPDYWYHISFEGQEGWVFGSQTSVMTEETKSNKEFVLVLERFIEVLKTDQSKIQDYVHRDYKLRYIQSGPGAYAVYEHNYSLDSIIEKGYFFKNYLDSFSPQQQISVKYYNGYLDKCDVERKGCLIKNDKLTFSRVSSIEEIFITFNGDVDLESEDFKNSDRYRKLLKIKKLESRITKEVTIGTGFHAMTFYFLEENSDWYLVVIDSNDCSA